MKNIWKRIYEIAFLQYSRLVCSETAGNCFKQRCVVVDHEEWAAVVNIVGRERGNLESTISEYTDPEYKAFKVVYLEQLKSISKKLEAAIQPF